MRSLLVTGVLIVAVIVYLAATSGMDAPPTPPSGVVRYEAVVERIRSLEGTRRHLMVAARLNSGAFPPARKAHTAGGVRAAYVRGYREGFGQGYAAGSFLSASTRPNPLFFPIPKIN